MSERTARMHIHFIFKCLLACKIIIYLSVYVHETDEVTGEGKRLQNKELHS